MNTFLVCQISDVSNSIDNKCSSAYSIICDFGGDRGHSAQTRGQRSEVVEMGVHPDRGSDQ